jgi:hypothetical protein
VVSHSIQLFELVVEGMSSTLQIFERSRGCVRSICLGKACLMFVSHCKGFDSIVGDGVLEMLQSWNLNSSCPTMLEHAWVLRKR